MYDPIEMVSQQIVRLPGLQNELRSIFCMNVRSTLEGLMKVEHDESAFMDVGLERTIASIPFSECGKLVMSGKRSNYFLSYDEKECVIWNGELVLLKSCVVNLRSLLKKEVL